MIMKNRWATVAYLVVVFGSGTMVGAVANRLYMTTTVKATAAPKTPAQARADFLQKLRTRVNASEEQVAQINAFLDDAKRKYSELDAQNKPLRDKIDQERIANVLSVLKPEQQKVYIAWRAEVKAKREQEAREQKALADKASPASTPSPQGR
ncbi:MAG: hypothetical protein JWN34_1200 [Bryobacterales bacterium]|nr:hypothetical protein [Bryobacterales bacterium]